MNKTRYSATIWLKYC